MAEGRDGATTGSDRDPQELTRAPVHGAVPEGRPRLPSQLTDTLTVRTVEAPLVSVVMVTHGGGETALEAIKALIENTNEPFELVVVDNASDDGTAALLQERIEGATIVENEDNVGFARASNQGAALCSGRFLCFINADSFVQPGWLRPLLQAFERDESVGVAVPLFLHEDGHVQEAGSAVDSRGVAFSIGDGDKATSFANRFPRPIDFGSGACFVIRADLFHEASGFDPIYTPAYYEDADLCFRLHCARLYHRLRARLASRSPPRRQHPTGTKAHVDEPEDLRRPLGGAPGTPATAPRRPGQPTHASGPS